jgi:hypothetical protein
MTPKEFKIKYPQYSNLEGDILWDVMIEMLLCSDNVLTADPNREIIYHEPTLLPCGSSISVEDNSTTRWLNSKGEEVKLKPEPKFVGSATESYRMIILDLSK